MLEDSTIARPVCQLVPLLIGLLPLAMGCGSSNVHHSTEHFPQQTGFVQQQVTVDAKQRRYWVFIPPDYHPDKLYPAVLFLHGLFENGNGNTNVLAAGLGPVIAQSPENWPFITIFPQSDGDWQGPERDRLAIAALDDAQDHFSIDPDRVILAGLSYGGLGVWEIGSQHKDRFAALVPVSGFAAPELADALAMMPVWAFASRGDMWVPPKHSQEMCDAIIARGGRARLTQFDGDAHDCWPQAVQESDLIEWMLGQRRNPLQSAARFPAPNGQSTGRLRSFLER